jgi:lipoprotein-anchoring transpeptidase ErfK/SrfK
LTFVGLATIAVACLAAGVASLVPAAGAASAAEPAPAPSAAPALTLTADSTTVTFGQRARLTARLGIPGVTLQVSREVAGTAGFTPLAALVTEATGMVTYQALPRATTTYRVEFSGDATQWLPASAEATVSVRPRIDFTATGVVYKGGFARLGLRVAPAHPGATVSIEMRREGAWVAWRAVKLSADSRAEARWRADRLGNQSFRVTVAADEEHAAGSSALRSVRVRPPNPYNVPVGAKRIVVVDKSQYRLYFFSYGREVKSFPCVIGRPSLPTPTGHFRIYAKGMWPGGPYGARIMSYHSPYAIHGTNEPHLLSRFPRNFSHGCTRLANANAIWLYDHAPVGTPVWNVP